MRDTLHNAVMARFAALEKGGVPLDEIQYDDLLPLFLERGVSLNRNKFHIYRWQYRHPQKLKAMRRRQRLGARKK